MKRFKNIILGFFLALAVLSCQRKPQNLSPLAKTPDWSRLESFQETLTRDEFLKLLEGVYVEKGAYQGFVTLFPNHAQIEKSNLRPGEFFILRFAPSPQAAKPVSHFWRSSPLSSPSQEQPLKGLKIALDPGHIGGEWAKAEQRWFQLKDYPPVIEGDMNLKVAKRVEARLKELGAEVYLVRQDSNPLTPLRSSQLRSLAKQFLKDRGVNPIVETYQGENDPQKESSLQWAGEVLAYQVAEIRERAKLINEKIKPDLTLCLHFDAQKWADPKSPALVDSNHMHLLINGYYTPDELLYEDVRYDLLFKILSRAYPVELAVAEKTAQAMAAQTGLPPGNYPAWAHAAKVGNTPYVWVRNLLANRLYQSPVIYLEPYVMNDQQVFERIQAGDYEGEKLVAGALRKSLYREYADAVVSGIVDYYSRPSALPKENPLAATK
ncbi:MAG: N-acetylmuramoyl-L-alanine amidase [bacterium]